MTHSPVHRDTFRVCFFDSEPSGRASVPSLCRFAQEAADAHCRTLGLSLIQLQERSLMWVIVRFRLCMERFPNCGENVTVETWASTRTNGIRAVRDFRFLAEDGSSLGYALSIWLMLDTTKRRAVNLPATVLEIRNAEKTIPGDFEYPRLPAPSDEGECRGFHIGWRDLDANNHANNVNYIAWALDALPLETCRDSTLQQLDAEFIAEAFYDQQIVSSASWNSETAAFNHRIRNAEGTTLALLRSRWQPPTTNIA